jgi:hypothetical protein
VWTRSVRLAGLLLVLALALGACGKGEKKGEPESEGGGTETCAGSAVAAGDLKLPDGFPTPDAVTFTESHAQGPSAVAQGYFEGDVKDAHDEWVDAFKSANWTVLSDELEEDDSEVNYQAPDDSSTGQVALRAVCADADRTLVIVTDRPA